MELEVHENDWWWGTTVTLVAYKGLALVEMKFDQETPNIVLIEGLSVLEAYRRAGLARQMLEKCHEIAREREMKFSTLWVEKNNVWLTHWYERMGYIKIREDEHLYQMLKVLDDKENRESSEY